ALEAVQDLVAVYVRHGEVEQDAVRTLLGHARQRLGAVAGQGDPVVARERRLLQLQDGLAVVHQEEERQRHGAPSQSWATRARRSAGTTGLSSSSSAPARWAWAISEGSRSAVMRTVGRV